MHPQFKELLELCSYYGVVSIPTNNSQDPSRWLPKHANRLLFRSTVHPEAEEKIDQYIAHARQIIDAGALFVAQYVVHPERAHRIAQLRELFAKHDIRFQPVAFNGEYDGKRYPHAHSEEEMEMLGLTSGSRSWYHIVEPHTTRVRNFRGIPCIAGHQSLYITRGGELRRCLYDPKTIEAPQVQPEPCGVNFCGCGLYLKELNSKDVGNAHEFWRHFSAPNTTRLNFAACAPGENWNEAVAREQMAMYDALIAAYGKDEFPER